MSQQDIDSATRGDLDDEAALRMVRRRFGPWGAKDETAERSRLATDAAYADAAERAERTWQAVGRYATRPELMTLREQALARARRAHEQSISGAGVRMIRMKWAAALCAVAVGLLLALQLSPHGYRPGTYRTGLDEQRTIALADRSRIVLDSRTRIEVSYSENVRLIRLLEGQAQFTVAKDRTRPFKVQAGDHTIVALGTVFDVEYVDREIRVAMLEGQVAVIPTVSSPQRAPDVELKSGQELLAREGQRAVVADADLSIVSAWRDRKVVFRDEPLSDAVRRMNRYSREQIVLGDSALADLRVSGVFDIGDTVTFAGALQLYLPVVVERSGVEFRWVSSL